MHPRIAAARLRAEIGTIDPDRVDATRAVTLIERGIDAGLHGAAGLALDMLELGLPREAVAALVLALASVDGGERPGPSADALRYRLRALAPA